MKKTNKLPVLKYILEKVNISRLKVNIRGVRLTPRTALNGEREKKAADLLAAQMTPTLAEFPRRPLRRISNSVASASTRWWRLSAASRSSAAPLRWKSDAANGGAAERSWKPGKIDPQIKKKAPLKSRMICSQPAWFSATVSVYAGWPHPNASISLSARTRWYPQLMAPE